MGVVDVDCILFSKVFQCAVQIHMAANNVGNRSRYQEVLLAVFAGWMVVVWIEHLTDCFCAGILTKRFDIVAAIESIHIDSRALCAPDTQHADTFSIITGNHDIIRNCFDSGVVFVQDMMVTIVPEFLDLAAKVNINGLFRYSLQPYLAAWQPVIRQLALPTIDNLLFEDTKLIQNRVADCRIAAGSKCIHEAGSQSSKTAVSKTSVRFQLEQIFHLDAHFFERFLKFRCKDEIINRVF